jgi:hypothetical protein
MRACPILTKLHRRTDSKSPFLFFCCRAGRGRQREIQPEIEPRLPSPAPLWRLYYSSLPTAVLGMAMYGRVLTTTCSISQRMTAASWSTRLQCLLAGSAAATATAAAISVPHFVGCSSTDSRERRPATTAELIDALWGNKCAPSQPAMLHCSDTRQRGLRLTTCGSSLLRAA